MHIHTTSPLGHATGSLVYTLLLASLCYSYSESDGSAGHGRLTAGHGR